MLGFICTLIFPLRFCVLEILLALLLVSIDWIAPLVVQVFALLVEKTKRIGGAMVENHKFCVFVHYGRVEEKVSYVCRGEVVGSLLHVVLVI